MFSYIGNKKGNVAILLTLTLTIFCGISAIVIDAGRVYITEFQLSNAVDSAALAGAQELPYKPDEAIIKAKEYARANNVTDEEIEVKLSQSNKIIEVIARRNIEFTFAKIIGFSDGNISKSAQAQVAPLIGLDGAVPLGIEECDFVFGNEYTLKVGAGGSDTGWFGALALGAPGASTYEDNLTYGYNGNIKIGDILDIQTGNISNPTKRAVDYRISECDHTPFCIPEHFERDCKRLIKIPVIQPLEHNQVKVVGFSVFLVDQVLGQGTENYIKGKFVRTVGSGEIDTNAEDFGFYGVKLIR